MFSGGNMPSMVAQPSERLSKHSRSMSWLDKPRDLATILVWSYYDGSSRTAHTWS